MKKQWELLALNTCNNSSYIFKDGNGYRVVLPIGLDTNGKKIYKKWRVKTKREAKQIEREMLIKYCGTTNTQVGNDITVNEYFSNWLKNIKRFELKPSAYDRLEAVVKLYIIPEIGHLAFASIEEEDVENLLRKEAVRGLGVSTLKKIYYALSGCYRYDCNKPRAKRLATHNPVSNLKLPSALGYKSPIVRCYSLENINKIIEMCYSRYSNGKLVYKYGPAYAFILNTGLRMGEALALDYKDVPANSKTLFICKNLEYAKHRDKNGEIISSSKSIVVQGAKTKSSIRHITLNKEARKTIEMLKANKSIDGSLISNAKGYRAAPQQFERTLRKICAVLDIECLGVHALRHTYASILYRNGVDIKVISKSLGHSSVSFTYDTYVHIFDEIDAERAEANELKMG